MLDLCTFLSRVKSAILVNRNKVLALKYCANTTYQRETSLHLLHKLHCRQIFHKPINLHYISQPHGVYKIHTNCSVAASCIIKMSICLHVNASVILI